MQRRSTRLTKKSTTQNELQEKKIVMSDSDSDEVFESVSANRTKLKKSRKKLRITNDSTSSSESDIENYLQPVDEIDLNSSFFDNKNNESFENIEKEIFSGVSVTRLSDSDSSSENNDDREKSEKTRLSSPSLHCSSQESPQKNENFEESEKIARLNFQKLQEYNKKLDEAKKSVELYQTKRNTVITNSETDHEKDINIEALLAKCESKPLQNDENEEADSGSESEQDWEEINEKQVDEKPLVPKEEMEITVELPTTMKKKKGIDLMAAIKRRLNRVRKENQVLIHKVHLLCWIAHGNYVNSVLNSESMIALGLSLIPSEKSFPSKRVDLSYLEQILKWYKKLMKLSEDGSENDNSLSELLTEQIEKKEAHSKRTLVLIFILILRSLGIQCRLVLSLQPEPLRPPSSDLHFLGTSDKKRTSSVKKCKNEDISIVEQKIKKEESHNVDTPDDKKSEGGKSQKKPATTSTTGNGKPNLKKLKKEESHSGKANSKTQTSSTSKKVKNEESHDKNTNEKKKTRNKSDMGKVQKKNQTSSISKKDKNEESLDKSMDEKKESRNRSDTRKVEKKTDSSSKKIEKSKDESRKKSGKSNSAIEKHPESSETRKRISRISKPSKGEDENDSKSDVSKTRSKSTRSRPCTVNLERLDLNLQKTRSKSASIPQVDGTNNEREVENRKFEEFYETMYQQVTFKKIPQLDGINDETSPKPNLKNLKNSRNIDECSSKNHRRSVKRTSYRDPSSPSDSDDDFMESPRKKLKTTKSNSSEKKTSSKDVIEDIMKLIKGRISEHKQLEKTKKVKKKKPRVESEDDSDFVPEEIPKKQQYSDDEFKPKSKAKPKEPVKKITKLKKPKDPTSRKIISSESEYTADEENATEKRKPEKKKGNDVWIEVFLETEEKWMSVDVIFGQIHCVNEIFSRASHPVSYVVAWSNENYIKDITRRYCQNYNTVTRKLRIDVDWWNESLKPFLGPNNARNREEDDELNREQLEKPLPTTISEYKNHPLYALERHLLKFESIYPPNAPPLGFVRNEPVYSRDCVHTLRSREIWLKEAKVVKFGEKPYKIVKARPKYDKLSNSLITGQNLEIFGPWQVEDYDPPTAENGMVPRNAFGNVDLFKPSMLPKKCVHLQLPGLNKIARRMNIDCASAIIGFDFHGGWSHPVYDGFVVCEEHEDELVAAWNIEQEELERKDQEKYEKRVYGNWRKLIKGLLIRERLKAKYGFGQTQDENDEDEEAEAGTSSENPEEPKKKVASSKNKKRRILSSDED